MDAELYDEIGDGEGIERFEIPASLYEAVLNTLNGAKKDSFPSKWQVLGEIDISHSGGLIQIQLFRTNERSGAFSADGTYYRGGSDAEFIALIRGALKQRSEQGEGVKASPATS